MLKSGTPKIVSVSVLKMEWFVLQCSNASNNVGLAQTVLLGSESAKFAETYLSEYLGFVIVLQVIKDLILNGFS